MPASREVTQIVVQKVHVNALRKKVIYAILKGQEPFQAALSALEGKTPEKKTE